jgi:hypothetical protein
MLGRHRYRGGQMKHSLVRAIFLRLSLGIRLNGMTFVVEPYVYTIPYGNKDLPVDQVLQGAAPDSQILLVGDIPCLPKNHSQDLCSDLDTSASRLG